MKTLDFDVVLPKLADIEEGIDVYLRNGEIDLLRKCFNDSSYDEIWPLRFELSNKYDIWEILRLGETERESLLRPYKQSDFRCNRKTPDVHAPCVSLIYAYRGSVECEFPDQYLELKEGELCLVNSDTMITFSSTNPKGFFLSIFFNKMYLNNVMLRRFPSDSLFTPFFEQTLFGAKHNMDYLVFDLRDQSRARDYYMTAVETYLLKPDCFQEIESSLLFLVFCELMKIWKERSAPTQPVRSEVGAYDIVNYIRDHYKTVTLASISEHFHFTSDHMRKTIKAQLNRNFVDIVQDVRLTAACQLLRETDLTISDVVAECGYQNITHFYKLFKNRYHCSPADYRNTKQNIVHKAKTDNEYGQNG